jgi:cytoskeleton protein RodZ
MPTLGGELKRKREERGITLSEISDATRIGTRFLKAIEENKFSTLPGGIFTRSFIRAYAKKVGMDEDEAITLYHDQVEAKPESGLPVETHVQAPSPQPPPSAPSPPSVFVGNVGNQAQKSSWRTAAIVAAFVLLIAVIVLMALRRSSGDESTSPKPSPSATGAPGGSQPGAKQPQAQQTTAQHPAGQSQTQPGAAQPAGQPIEVVLEATAGESWVKYQVDEGTAEAVILKPGESKSLPLAQDKVKLNLGNRTTLKLKIDKLDATFPPDTPNFKAQILITHDNLGSFIAR